VGPWNRNIVGSFEAWKGLHGILMEIGLKVGIHNVLLISITRVIGLVQGMSKRRYGSIVDTKTPMEVPTMEAVYKSLR
jgi:hypothetical protein